MFYLFITIYLFYSSIILEPSAGGPGFTPAGCLEEAASACGDPTCHLNPASPHPHPHSCPTRMLEAVGSDSEDLAIVRYKLGTFYYVQVRVGGRGQVGGAPHTHAHIHAHAHAHTHTHTRTRHTHMPTKVEPGLGQRAPLSSVFATLCPHSALLPPMRTLGHLLLCGACVSPAASTRELKLRIMLLLPTPAEHAA